MDGACCKAAFVCSVVGEKMVSEFSQLYCECRMVESLEGWDEKEMDWSYSSNRWKKRQQWSGRREHW